MKLKATRVLTALYRVQFRVPNADGVCPLGSIWVAGAPFSHQPKQRNSDQNLNRGCGNDLGSTNLLNAWFNNTSPV